MGSGHFALRELDFAAACNEVHDDRDDGEDQEQVDEQAGDMKKGETAEPGDDEDDCENEEHKTFFQDLAVLTASR